MFLPGGYFEIHFNCGHVKVYDHNGLFYYMLDCDIVRVWKPNPAEKVKLPGGGASPIILPDPLEACLNGLKSQSFTIRARYIYVGDDADGTERPHIIEIPHHTPGNSDGVRLPISKEGRYKVRITATSENCLSCCGNVPPVPAKVRIEYEEEKVLSPDSQGKGILPIGFDSRIVDVQCVDQDDCLIIPPPHDGDGIIP